MKNIHLSQLVRLAFTVIVLVFGSSCSFANPSMDKLIALNSAPQGVVFEIVDWEDDHLADAIPWVNKQIITLRNKFPNIDIAVVSHGSEQFALLSDAKYAYPQIHKKVQGLIADHNIKLELCLTHANMRGFDKSEFPDYVDIEASGPSQISAYQALGYELVVVDID